MPARSVQPSTLLPVGPTGPLAASDPNGLRPAPSAAVPRRLRLATLGAIVVGALVFVSAGSPALAGPVFLVGLILGLPHGAADHVTLALATGRRPSRREATTTAGLYGLGVAVAVMGYLADPAAVLLLALALSVFHFGTSDGGPLRAAPITVMAFGLLPVVGPLTARPAQSDQVLTVLAPSLAAHWQGMAAVLVGAGVGGAAIAAAAVALRTGDWLEAAEIAGLVLTVAVLPPLAAFGLYFGLWHAPRHVGVLLGGPDRRPARAQPRRITLRCLVGSAWLPTLVAFAGLLAFWMALPRRFWLPIGLGGLLAVSLPHTIVVTRLRRSGYSSGVADRSRAVWRTAPRKCWRAID
jgi:Brp/Blh family beta-carotene 15,15'-monooxygenase